jgi:hypothetical protein
MFFCPNQYKIYFNIILPIDLNDIEGDFSRTTFNEFRVHFLGLKLEVNT